MSKKNRSIFLFILLISMLWTPAAHSAAASSSQPTNDEKLSLQGFLNPDGTLDLSSQLSGALDLDGWNVSMDPSRGPVFAKQVAKSSLNTVLPGDWSSVGETPSNFSNPIETITVSGTDVYVGGYFTDAAGLAEADHVAKWDGTSWSALGDNGSGDGALSVGSNVYAFAVDGTNVYIAGYFNDVAGVAAADYVAKWDGTSWSALGDNGSGNGALNNQVWALAVFGTDVFVGGTFTNAAGVPEADYMAKWDGTGWSALGNNGSGNGALNNPVNDLAVSGTDVYVGGEFTNAAGVAEADYLGKWNGTNWSALGDNGSGDGALNSYVDDLAVSGTDVYVGGYFTNAAGVAEADYLSKWNGTNWSALGDNGSGDGALNNEVYALVVSGTDVYVGGYFTDAAGVAEADYFGKWNGTNWSALGDNGSGDGALNHPVNDLAVSGTDVYVGGYFTYAAGVAEADYLGKWNGTNWTALGNNGSGNGALNSYVYAIAVSGTDVYVGGGFVNAAGIPEADRVAKWDGTSWSALGTNGSGDGALNNSVRALAVSGTDIYVSGIFTNVAGVPEADRVAKWDGTNWSALGDNGSGDGALNNNVYAIAFSGTNMYAGGNFTNAAGLATADYVAKWDGTNWSALGNNGTGDGALNSYVSSLAVSDTGVFVGGNFTNAGGVVEADFLGKWNGTNWSALGNNGSGNGALNSRVSALAVSGTDVFVGGNFTNAVGLAAADYVAKWDGMNWAALGTNSSGDGALNGNVNAITVSGTDVYVGGEFTNAAGVAEADFLGKWNRTNWYALGDSGSGDGAFNNPIYALAISSNPMIYTGGAFTNVNNGGAVLLKADYLAGGFQLPDIAAPANGSHVLSLRPVFDWEDAPSAISYILQISRVSTFTKLLKTVATTASSYTPTKDLPVNSTLYWRYRPNTSAVWSTVDSFTTGTPPSVPVLSIPRPKGLITDFTPLLLWKPVSVPVGTFLKYQVQVDNNPDFSSPEVDDSSVTNVLTPQLESPASLNPDSIYYWRVRAFNSLGEYSTWSKLRYLRTAILPPALSAPAAGATLNSLRPSFTWTATDALGYTIQISNVADFSHLVLSKKTTLPSYSLSFDLLPNTPYFWRVKVNKAAPGHFGPSGYSTVYSFTTGNPPGIPVLISPANGSSTTIHSPTFNWSDVPAFATFDHYQIQIATDSLFSNVVHDNYLYSITNSQDNYAVLSIGKYYWRVRTWTPTDYSSWSKVFSIIIK